MCCKWHITSFVLYDKGTKNFTEVTVDTCNLFEGWI